MQTDVRTLAPTLTPPAESASDGATASLIERLASHASLAPSDRLLVVGDRGLDTIARAASRVARLTVLVPDRARADAAAARLAGSGATVLSSEDPGAARTGSYDAIIVSTARALVPGDLLDRLAPGGRLVMPAGEDATLTVRVTKRPDGIEYAELLESDVP